MFGFCVFILPNGGHDGLCIFCRYLWCRDSSNRDPIGCGSKFILAYMVSLPSSYHPSSIRKVSKTVVNSGIDGITSYPCCINGYSRYEECLCRGTGTYGLWELLLVEQDGLNAVSSTKENTRRSNCPRIECERARPFKRPHSPCCRA